MYNPGMNPSFAMRTIFNISNNAIHRMAIISIAPYFCNIKLISISMLTDKVPTRNM
jgi:hypothetical protein